MIQKMVIKLNHISQTIFLLTLKNWIQTEKFIVIVFIPWSYRYQDFDL